MLFKDWLIVVPARLAARRLPKKLLLDLGGKPLIVQVCNNLKPLVEQGAKLLVATDSPEILQVCINSGFEACMTSEAHTSGSDRVWEAAAQHAQELILNVQGDEPFVAITDLQRLMRNFAQRPEAGMATLVYPSNDNDAFLDPNVVKAVVGDDRNALYFSRNPIPHGTAQQGFYQHLGIYAFRRDTLQAFTQLPMSTLEKRERLEQLRALENGVKIFCENAAVHSVGIDCEADLLVAREWMAQQQERV